MAELPAGDERWSDGFRGHEILGNHSRHYRSYFEVRDQRAALVGATLVKSVGDGSSRGASYVHAVFDAGGECRRGERQEVEAGAWRKGEDILTTARFNSHDGARV